MTWFVFNATDTQCQALISYYFFFNHAVFALKTRNTVILFEFNSFHNNQARYQRKEKEIQIKNDLNNFNNWSRLSYLLAKILKIWKIFYGNPVSKEKSWCLVFLFIFHFPKMVCPPPVCIFSYLKNFLCSFLLFLSPFPSLFISSSAFLLSVLFSFNISLFLRPCLRSSLSRHWNWLYRVRVSESETDKKSLNVRRPSPITLQ